MTTTAAALDAPDARPVVRFDRLLALYLIVPLCIAVAAADLAVFRGALRERLPSHPDKLLLFTALFNFPHIIASHLIFLDGEYVRAYGKRALAALGVLVAITGVCVLIGDVAIFLFAMVVTHFHIVGQQVGLTGAQLRASGSAFQAWRWLSQLSAGCLLLSVLDPVAHFAGGLTLLATALLVPSTVLVVYLSQRATAAGARRYLWANQAMFYAMAACQWAGYPLLTVLMPRVVHDVSAFYVYGVHDTNHNRATQPNMLYRAAGKLKLPPALVGPVVAVSLALVVERMLPELLRLHVVYWLSGLHYYLEAVVWKSGTPHRRSVSFL